MEVARTNVHSDLGAKARGERVGVISTDAHTDLNTPKTSLSANIHGMPVASSLGHGPPELTPALSPDGDARNRTGERARWPIESALGRHIL